MIVVADYLRVTLAAVGRAVERLDPEPIRQMVSTCMDAGAQAIDINSGPLPRAPEEKMTFLAGTVRKTADPTVVLDPALMRVAGSSQRIADGTVFSWQ